MKMAADIQAGIAPGHLDGVLRARLSEHKACTTQHSFAITPLNGEICALVHAEVIRDEFNGVHAVVGGLATLSRLCFVRPRWYESTP
jgi:hypothetical protein